MSNDTKKPDPKVEVEITADGHTHRGQPCKVGDRITLRKSQVLRFKARVKEITGAAVEVARGEKA